MAVPGLLLSQITYGEPFPMKTIVILSWEVWQIFQSLIHCSITYISKYMTDTHAIYRLPKYIFFLFFYHGNLNYLY